MTFPDLPFGSYHAVRMPPPVDPAGSFMRKPNFDIGKLDFSPPVSVVDGFQSTERFFRGGIQWESPLLEASHQSKPEPSSRLRISMELEE
jgi:hypothetical protein